MRKGKKDEKVQSKEGERVGKEGIRKPVSKIGKKREGEGRWLPTVISKIRRL